MCVSVEILDWQFFHLDEHLVAHVLQSLSGDSDKNIVVKIMKSCAHDVHNRHNAYDSAEVRHSDFRRSCDDFLVCGDVYAVLIRKRKNVVVDHDRAEHKRTRNVAKHVCDHTNERTDKLTFIRLPISENTLERLHRIFGSELVLLRCFIHTVFFVFRH